MTSDGVDNATGDLRSFAGRMIPANARLAAAEAEGLKQDNLPCGMPLEGGGCNTYIQSVNTALEQFGAYFNTIEQGYAGYQSVANDSATDYANRDDVGRAEVERALNLSMLPRSGNSPQDELPLPLQESGMGPRPSFPGALPQAGAEPR
ncbi:hypothetical protein GCM10010191_45810 [Actinomadura vinacea]|uniref:PE domain-containing protein n=1 Tax=Actinomadura vinacea TaxID=115336 RepID=A0ABN3JGC2_9ACTN